MRKRTTARRNHIRDVMQTNMQRAMSHRVFEPIRVVDRRQAYNQKIQNSIRRNHFIQQPLAPRRLARKIRNNILQKTFPEAYQKLHNCKREWRKVLSWRSGQGSGRKRTSVELQKSKKSFIDRDC